MKTIAFASNTSWYLYNFRKNSIKGCIAQGFDVVCIAPPDDYSTKLIDLGARFVSMPLEASSTNILKEFRLIFWIAKFLSSERPSYIFNFTIKMNLYVGFIASRLSIPYANNISGLGTAFIHDGFFFQLVRKIYGFANIGAHKVFFQNADDLELFVTRKLVNPDNAILLPGSGVDLERFLYRSLPAPKPLVFLMISRLIADKGVREFIAASEIVKERHKETRFILVGPAGVKNRSAIGPDEISQWRNEGVVELDGAQDDVLPWLNSCHVFVLPSYREGLPKTVIEAAAVGRPAIVTDVPGCRHAVVADQTGWLCEARDANSLANVMLQIYSLVEKEGVGSGSTLERFSKNAQARARICFSEEIVINAYMNCLASLD